MVRFYCIKWLIRPHMVCQGEAVEGLTSPGAMQKEERPPGSTGLKRYYRSARDSIFFRFCLQSVRQVFYGRSGEEGRQRNLLATNLLNSSNKTSGKQRMSSQIEEVIPKPNRSHVQELFPNLHELMMHHRRWSYKGFSHRESDRRRLPAPDPVNLTIGHQR